MATQPIGPFNTYEDASAAVDAALEQFPDIPIGRLTPALQRYAGRRWITAQLDAAGVERGKYDEAGVAYLATMPPTIIVTVLGWVSRSRGVNR